MIELDVTPEERRAQIIRNCGANPIGERPQSTGGFQSLCWFVDPVTNSTCVLPIEEVTEERVRQKLISKLHEFYGNNATIVRKAS